MSMTAQQPNVAVDVGVQTNNAAGFAIRDLTDGVVRVMPMAVQNERRERRVDHLLKVQARTVRRLAHLERKVGVGDAGHVHDDHQRRVMRHKDVSRAPGDARLDVGGCDHLLRPPRTPRETVHHVNGGRTAAG